MPANHQDLVARARNAHPDMGTEAAIFDCLLHVLALLPASEGAGLLRKDAGENIIFYAPGNCHVSISRVCYPDGSLIKVFTDSGPGGANGAAWNDDGSVEVSRYISLDAPAVVDPLPDHPPALHVPEPEPGMSLLDVVSLFDALHRDYVALAGQVQDALNATRDVYKLVAEIHERPAPTVVFPEYQGKIPYLGSFTIVPKA